MYGQPNNPNRLQLLARVSWDAAVPAAQLDELVQGHTNRAGTLTRKRLFQRLAESFSWYTLLDLLTAKELQYLLQNEVIDGLRSAALRQNYTHAQQRLQGII